MVRQGQNIFLFNFYDEEVEKEKEYRFHIHAQTPEQFQSLTLIDQGADKKFNEFLSDMEGEYGVHDVSFGDTEFYGFTSYEVVPNRYDDLLNQWREFFSKRGFHVSDVF